ncbi:F-box/kelch-repeat protein At3g23880-like [Quercus robur]|uniref:F-box/kelch-repeat protein At3g23880-like n=1 Tax=Quercus robur TaxID=38942 RepID=UPI0021638B98|nr:F-box/kelch-repeat protein At3g23880-like [Quercus robur]
MERSRFNLPQDLLEEILSRLPVKSLIRFKCVKKSWSNLLQNRNFIAKQHYNRCSQTHPSLLAESLDYTIWGSPITPRYFLSLHTHPDDDEERTTMVAMTTRLPRMCVCINGIICLAGSFVGFNGFVLWNPAIRQYKLVSYPNFPFPAANCFDCFAFGYDHISDDYKAVSICARYWNTGNSFIYMDSCVHVYTLSTDSWRQINPAFDHSDVRLHSYQNGIYLNGVHHWLGLLMDKFGQCECEIIVSFDMGNEVFQITKLPELDNVLREKYKFFAAFNGCLALIYVDKIEETLENVFDIWVMCEFGVKGSWTKQLVVITPQLEIARPLGFAKNEELFLLSKDKHAVFLYNIGSQEIKNLPFRGLLNSNRKGHVRVYVESLVSFTGGYVFQYNQAPNDFTKSIIDRFVWDQIDLSDPTWACSKDAQQYASIRDEFRFYEFLMSLHKDFEPIRSQLLNHSPAPSLDTVVNELVREEIHLATLQAQNMLNVLAITPSTPLIEQP